MFITLLSLFSAPSFLNIRINSDTEPALPYHNEEQIVVNPKDSANLVACWRDFRLGYRQVAIGVSFDGGLTWEDRLITNSGLQYDSDPGLTTDADGNIYLVMLSFNEDREEMAIPVYKSTDGGLTFGEPSYAVHSYGTTFLDKELMACDRTESDYRGNLYVVWTYVVDETTYIYCVTSGDGGKSWSEPARVSDVNRVMWPVPCVGPDGTLYVAWIARYAVHEPDSIMIDRSTDGGITWGNDLAIARVKGFCTIDFFIDAWSFPAMDTDISGGPFSGNLYIAYMSSGLYETKDIFLVRSTDGGDTWSSPITISGEDTPYNDQFHPWLVVDNLGIIHVVFYDQRNGLEEDLQDLYYTKSEDGGDTWTYPYRVSTVASKPAEVELPCFAAGSMPAGIYGEYVGLAAWNGRPFPVWTDCREDGVENIYFGWYDSEAVAEHPRAESQELKSMFVPGGLKVSFHAPMTGRFGFKLFDVSGRGIFAVTRVLNHSREVLLDAGDLPKGIYYLHTDDNAMIRSTRLVKIN